MEPIKDIVDRVSEESKPCMKCGGREFDEILRPSGIHHADRICKACKTHNGFVKKPDGEKWKRSPIHKRLLEKYTRHFCELCLREEAALPKGQALVAHHVIPYKDDGEPARHNVWVVCSRCHSLIEHERTYSKTKQVEPCE